MSGRYERYLDSIDDSEYLISMLMSEQERITRVLSARIAKLEKSNARLARTNKSLASEQKKLKGRIDRLQKDKGIVSRVKRVLPRRGAAKASDAVHDAVQEEAVVSSITVVIPTYKENDYLPLAVESALLQEIDVPVHVLIVVNCDNGPWYETLVERYADNDAVSVHLIEKQGAGAARNFAIQVACTSHLTFLDDDDYLTAHYLAKLAENATADTDIVCAPFETDGSLEDATRYEYLNTALSKVEKRKVKRPDLVGLFSTVAGKLYDVEFLKHCAPFCEEAPNSEDILFWADNYGLLADEIGVIPIEDERYVRRVLDDSLSRPSSDHEFTFYVEDRLFVLHYLESIAFDTDIDIEHVRFIFNLIKAQTSFIRTYFDEADEAGKQAVRKAVNSYQGLCLNKGWFSDVDAIAFCYNFAPTNDPSAFVATKRLGQIDDNEGASLRWHVISKNMADKKTVDPMWNTCFASFAYATHKLLPGVTSDSPRYSTDYAIRAFWETRGIEAKVIYSRSMFPASHIAAYLYKRAHPEAIWYAEFSDPLSYNSKGQFRDDKLKLATREDSEKMGDFFEECELLPYEHADHIIFTNDVQKEFMLSRCRNAKLVERARKLALTWHHPIIDARYVHLVDSEFATDERIQIGYFGSFYATRSADDVIALTNRPDVVLHLFVSKPEELTELASENIVIHELKPYFEFLNIASKMDYLFIADMQPIDGVTPWLPSKLSDYIATGVPIIAKCNEGSPLSQEDYPQIIHVDAIDEALLESLHKKEN